MSKIANKPLEILSDVKFNIKDNNISIEGPKGKLEFVKPDDIIITPGGKAVIFYALLILGQPNVEIITPDPGFIAYRSMIDYTGAKAIALPHRMENNFSFDADELLSLINKKTNRKMSKKRRVVKKKSSRKKSKKRRVLKKISSRKKGNYLIMKGGVVMLHCYGEDFNINNMFDCDLFYASNNLGICNFKCDKKKIYNRKKFKLENE